jgi:hypothetical protein
MKPVRKADPVRPFADRVRLPACIAPIVVEHMSRVCRAATFGDMDDAIAAMFSDCLPHMFAEYGDLFIDCVDLEQAVTSYLPATLASWLADLVDIGVGRRLYPAHICRYVAAAMREAATRLDRTMPPLPWVAADDGAAPLEPKQIAYLVLLLEECTRDFAATVLIGGPPPPPTTKAQRAAARKRRLGNHVRFQRRVNGLKENLCSICRAAGVPRKGRGSAARWIDGTLPDSAKTSRLIEDVLAFKSTPLQSPTAVGSHSGHEFFID